MIQKRKGSIIALAYKSVLYKFVSSLLFLCVYCDMLSIIGVITLFILLY